MICPICGNEIDDKKKVCSICGYELDIEEMPKETKPSTEEVTSYVVAEKEENEFQEGKYKVIEEKASYIEKDGRSKGSLKWAILAIVFLFVGISIFFAIRKIKADDSIEIVINLNDYVVIEEIGIDGQGELNIYVDWENVKKDYGDIVQYKKVSSGQYQSIIQSQDPIDFLQRGVEVFVSPYNGLANGDEALYAWKVDEEIVGFVDCNLLYEATTYTLSALERESVYEEEERNKAEVIEKTEQREEEIRTPEANTEKVIIVQKVIDNNENTRDEYVIYDSSSRLISRSDLIGMTSEQLELARNEIFARHGRIFKDEFLREYFESCSWYRGSIQPEKFDDSYLNQVEKRNVSIIIDYENELEKEQESIMEVSALYDIEPEKWMVNTTVLRTPIYVAPSEDSEILCYITEEKTVITIVKVCWDLSYNFWGLLESGEGWVNLYNPGVEKIN